MIHKTLSLIACMGLCLCLGCNGGKTDGEAGGDKAGDKAGGDKAGADAAGGQGAADAGPRGDAKAGEAIYKAKCAPCHQADGKGMNGALGGNFVDDKTLLAKPDSVLLGSIAEGVKGKKAVMPPQKDLLSEQERKDALAYIRETYGDK